MANVDNLFSCFEEENLQNESIISRQTSINDVRTKRKNDDDSGPTKSFKSDPMLDPGIDIVALNPGIDVHTISRDDGCVHEVAVPPKHKFPNLKNIEDPAKTYKFELDSFQKKAVTCVDNNQSVLVSAHTSAGKTVVAEYAIALALRNKQRVIYTTPIKALSNQKYREMLQEFKDVGIMTGDVTINPMASCIIMTTEILRSMLFKGSEITREVGWVIFDEIHYMRDSIRGVVWEETLILLPDNVRYVFLSATIPNARQFAEWVSHVHQEPCHVVYTEYRPTPLHHYLLPSGGSGMHLVIDEKGKLIQENFDSAMANISLNEDSIPITSSIKNTNINPKKTKMQEGEAKNIVNVVKTLMEKNLAPLIIFSFQRSACEVYAMKLSKLTFNTAIEQKLVEEVFNNAIDILSESEKQLPQVTKLLPLLKKGIAFHHSGLLPLIKETVEILFGEGLIKALFATETFAMGLNMPAKTVIFTSIKKYDGVVTRYVTSGEYIQMSGRAGRRGLDEFGLVVLMVDEKMSSDLVAQIMMGKADPLNSAFHLTYSMILNLLRQEELNPEYMIEKSFFMFQLRAKLHDLCRNLKSKQKKYANIHINNEDAVISYCSTTKQLEELHEEVRDHILSPRHIWPFLNEGRLVKLKSDSYEYDWGVILGTNVSEDSRRSKTTIDVMLHVRKEGLCENGLPIPAFTRKKGRVAVFTLDYRLIHQISSERIQISHKDKQKQRCKLFLKSLNKLKTVYPHGLPLVHPVEHMGIQNPEVEHLIDRIRSLEKILSHNTLFNTDNKLIIANFNRKEELFKEISELNDEIKKIQSVIMMDELGYRKNVLRKLGYCNEIDVISVKGRVACELACCDELLLTEMIFNGIFNDLPVDYCVAVLSCFVCDEKESILKIDDVTIVKAMNLVKNIISMIGDVSLECKVINSKDQYTDNKLQGNLAPIVLEWCRGKSFLYICKMSDMYEGSIIRYLRLLDEVLRQLCKAATNVGNTDLENRFSEGIRLLHRGVVFAGSLYL